MQDENGQVVRTAAVQMFGDVRIGFEVHGEASMERTCDFTTKYAVTISVEDAIALHEQLRVVIESIHVAHHDAEIKAANQGVECVYDRVLA